MSDHEHGDWDQGGYCNRLVLGADGYAEVCGYMNLGELYDSNALQSYTAEVTFNEVDPEVFALLTGQGSAQYPKGHAIEVFQQVPVRRRAWRVVWEWLTRKPRQYETRYMHLPNVEMVSGNPETGEYEFKPIHSTWGVGPFHTQDPSTREE